MSTANEPPFYEDTPLALLSSPAFITGKRSAPIAALRILILTRWTALIRGFNSIYQQAPRLSASDYKDFTGYCLAWHRCVEQHHMHEEVNYFPEIERMTGQKGVMDGEVEHHGLQTLKDYLTNLKNPASDFQPKKLLEIMDSFSEPLYAHLTAEPQTLLALSRFATPERQFDLVKIEQEQGKKAVTWEFALNTLPMFMNNMELVEFEGGMWKNHPAVPPVVRWIMKKVIPMWNWRIWRFMSCDSDGKRKRLVA